MIGQLAAGEGKTVLVSSHILTELAEMCNHVGIIEKGELLAVGSVHDIQQQVRTQREVSVGVLDDSASAANWLSQQPLVTEVTTENSHVRFSHPGDRNDEAELLRDMVNAGIRVAEFRSHKKSLEDVFMHITQGRVQ